MTVINRLACFSGRKKILTLYLYRVFIRLQVSVQKKQIMIAMLWLSRKLTETVANYSVVLHLLFFTWGRKIGGIYVDAQKNRFVKSHAKLEQVL